MKTFEIYTTNFARKVQAENILSALTQFQLDNPFEMVMAINQLDFDLPL